MRKELFMFVFLILFCNFIQAQPPFEQVGSFENGYEIKFPQFGHIKAGEDFEFSFHVFNSSNGIPVDNSSTNCNFHLYNNTGKHLISAINITHTEKHGVINEWEFLVKGNNFSVGCYNYIISCNSILNGLGGFENVNFDVTITGEQLIYYDAIIRIFLIIFFMSLFGLYYKMNEKINYDQWYNSLVKKYSKKNGVKTILWGMAYFVIKNKGINSYLIGFPIVLLLYQIILDYNIYAIKTLFETIVFLYSYGIIIVGISWFGRLWEFVNMMRSDIGEEMWGVRK